MQKYLKKANGKVYGPVPLDDIIHWAIEGRVAPDDAISDDGARWSPAANTPELGMQWLVDIPGDRPYGPLNLHAMVDMVRDGIVTPDSRITHRDTGEARVLSEALVETLVERNETLQNSVDTLRAHLAELREREKTMAEASDQAMQAASAQNSLNRKLEELRVQNQALQEQSKDWQARFLEQKQAAEQAAAAHQAARQGLEAELAGTREKAESLAARLDGLTAETETLRGDLSGARQAILPVPAPTEETSQLRATLEQTQAEHKTERDQLRKQIKALEQQIESAAATTGSYKELATTIDNLEKDIARWQKLYDDEREAARKREETLKQRIEELRVNEASALTRLEDVNRRLRHTQRSYDMMAKAAESADPNDPESVVALQMSVLMDSHNELSQSYDTLFTQLQAKAEELDRLMASRRETETRAEERIEQMEAILKREQEEADRARRQLADMQQSHFQLVKSYREMNDRFIRLRQQLTAPAADRPAPVEAPAAAKPAPAPGKPASRGPRIRLNR